MEISDLQGAIDYIKAMKVVYPAVEWRITMNGKLVDEDEDEPTSHANISHASNSLALIVSMLFYTFFMK